MSAAFRAWRSARAEYEETLTKGGDIEAAAERVSALQQVIEERVGEAARLLLEAARTFAPTLEHGLDGLLAVAEQQALDAERSARHSEMAGVNANAEARADQLAMAHDAVVNITEQAAELLAAMEALRFL